MIVGYIKGQSFSLSSPTIASGTIDHLTAFFTFFTSEWEKCNEIWVHFSQGDTVYDAEIIEGKVNKDQHINLDKGEWEVYLHGNVNVNGEVVERITTEKETLFVKESGIIDGAPFPSVEASTAEKILAKAQHAVEIAEGVREDFDDMPTGGGLTPEQEAEIQANTAARHTHDNYWSLSDLHCVASEAEQGGNNPFPILPDYVGVDRPTFKGNYLSYCSDGAVIGKVEEKDDGEKFLRLWLYNGPLDTNFNVPDFIDIPVKTITEKVEEFPSIGTNGAGLEVDLGIGGSDGGLTPEQAADLEANTQARHEHKNKGVLDNFKTNNGLYYDNTRIWIERDGSLIKSIVKGEDEVIDLTINGGTMNGEKFEFVTPDYVTAAINGSLDEIEAMIDESGVLDE